MITPLSLGQVIATPGVLKLLEETGEDPLHLVARHRSGDWGELHEHDRRENELSVRHCRRLLSSYPVGGGKVWITTEADHSYTTILLPEEY